MSDSDSPSVPAAPDYSALAAASSEAAKINAQTAREQLQWARDQYDMNREVSDPVIDTMLGQLDFQDENARADRQRYEDIYQPLEEQQAQRAQDYSSQGRQEIEAGKAEANVAQQFEQARNAAQQRLESFGVDPSQTRSGALDYQSRIAEAASQAAAGNQARDAVEARGDALMANAVNVGRGYPAQVAGSVQGAQGSGNAAVNQGLATTQSGASTMGTAPQYGALQNANIGTWGNLLNTGFQNQMATYKAENEHSSGMGSALGAGLGLATMFLAEGGEVPPAIPLGQHPGAGQFVPPQASASGGAVTDDVSARLNVGEFVLPKDVTSWLGEEKLQKLIEQSRAKKAEAGAQPQAGVAPAGPPTVNTTGPAIPMGAPR